MRDTHLAHLTLLALNAIIMFGGEFKLQLKLLIT
jgi:hypothetical protein